MTRAATIIPAETDLLCEGCGYTLNGLPDDSNCPECGKPIIESLRGRREVPAWERAGGRSIWNFLVTSAEVTFRPTNFYKTLATRREVRPARQFANIHWLFRRLLLPPESITTYLYVLCGVVVVFAAFLFHTYWIGMRNMMYANR